MLSSAVDKHLKYIKILMLSALAAGTLSACVPDKASSRDPSSALPDDILKTRIADEALRAIDFTRKAQNTVTASAQWASNSLDEGAFDTIGLALPGATGLWHYNAAYCKERSASSGASLTVVVASGDPDAATTQDDSSASSPEEEEENGNESIVVWPSDFNTTIESTSLSHQTALMSQKVVATLGSGSAGVMGEGGVVALSGQRPSDGSTHYTLPSGCQGLAIPNGAPVIILTFRHNDPGSTESANISYTVRTCDANQTGTRITTRYAHKEDDKNKKGSGIMIIEDEDDYLDVCADSIELLPVSAPTTTTISRPTVTVTSPSFSAP